MTTSTTNLGLTTYNGITDGSTLFAAYVSKVSGSGATDNLAKIDVFAGRVSGSLTGLSASVVEISASIVVITSQIVPIGTTAQVTAGSSNGVVVSASGLAHSNYGKRIVVVPLNTSASLTTADVNYLRIPEEINGWILTKVVASATGSSLSGSPVFTIFKSGSSVSAYSTNMLATDITIGEGEYDSGDYPTQPVISTTASSVFTGERLKFGNSASGSHVEFAQISATFQNLP